MDKKIKRKMETEYFEYNGQRYYAGTMFTMVKQWGWGSIYGSGSVVTAEFWGYDDEDDSEYLRVSYKIKKPQFIIPTYEGRLFKRDEIQDHIIEILPTNCYVEREKSKRYCKDSDIPELVVGWPLYIFLMFVAMLFHGTIGAWILLTVGFFTWRNHLKKKEYFYYE